MNSRSKNRTDRLSEPSLQQRKASDKNPAFKLVMQAGFLTGLLALYSGCSRAPAQSTGPAPGETWNWETVPVVDKMRLGLLPCRVQPKSSTVINSPATGLLHLYVDRPQTNLPAGFIWGEFEPKLLAGESSALQETKQRLDERERLLLELEVPKQKLKLLKEIDEVQKQTTILEMLSTNRDVAPAIIGLMGLKDKSVTQEALERSKKELKVLRDSYRYLEATNLTLLGVDLQSPRTDLQHRQLEFERQQNQARLKMSTACQLNISFPLAEKVSDYPVNSGQELAVLRDMTSILLRAILSDPSWSTLPTERLKAVISLPDGTRLEAPFELKRLEKVQMREDVVYYFQFPTNRADAAARMMGTDVSCELWMALPEPARVIPKLTLAINRPAAFSNRRWNEGVSQLAKGARVLVEGQTDLAITVPKPTRTHDSR